MRFPRTIRSFSRIHHEKGEKNETLIEGSFYLGLTEKARLVGEYPRRVRLGDCLAYVEDCKLLSPANGIAVQERIRNNNFLKITQDGGLEPPHEFNQVPEDQNTFFNLLDKNGLHSLDFENTSLVTLFKNFSSVKNSELILSPFSLYQSPNFQELVWKDYRKEWDFLVGLLEKIFPDKKIHNYWNQENLKYSYPMGIPDYFSDRIAGFSILGENPKDVGRIFYLGSETIWHMIRGLYYDLPFTRRHLSVYCVDRAGRIDGRERSFLLSNGQSFRFLQEIFAKDYNYYSLDHFFNPTKIYYKDDNQFFDIFEDSTVAFYTSPPKPTTELPCTECNECSYHCPTLANPSALMSEISDFDVKSCVFCGLCNLYCPSGIDLRKRILNLQGER